jgi:CO/xanthine dehydrogenase FAD-binding subunit
MVVIIHTKGDLTLFTIKNYVVVKDLEEAYTLNQKRNNVVLGGIAWLKMGERNIQNAIDLSGLGLDKIEETEEAFEIGCMVTLRDLETHPVLNSYFNGAIAKSTEHIVGVQFRNCATVGGSIFSRFGFSDLLTCFLALDAYVQLYKGGVIPLAEFAEMPRDNDILVKLIIKKDAREVSYLTHRRTATDIPVIACTVARVNHKWQVVLGARPSKAKLLLDKEQMLSHNPTEEEITKFIEYIKENIQFGSNMRANAEFRQHLAGVLCKRGIKEIAEGKVL